MSQTAQITHHHDFADTLARDRYQQLEESDREEFRAALRDYVRMYAALLPASDGTK